MMIEFIYYIELHRIYFILNDYYKMVNKNNV